MGVLLLAGMAGLYALYSRLPSLVEERAIRILRERYDSEVEFGRFSISLFPRLVLSGEDLNLRHKGRTDVPPLISIKAFSVESGVMDFLETPARVRKVRVEGLMIRIPRGEQKGEKPRSQPRRDAYPVEVDEFDASDVELHILPKRADKLPLIFLIHQLEMKQAGLSRSAPFHATLTNPKPKGEIETTGHFGPWQRDDPGLTPVSGDYTFENADLGTFRGLIGTLNSKGRYQGVLERIEADGETSTPNFGLTISGHTLPLHTRFHAVIDGTNGETLLQPVDAQLGRSTLQANGGVVKTPNARGRTVALDVVVSNGRLEDLLSLAVKGEPPLTGAVRFRTQFLLPPGEQDVVDRLGLKGRFIVSSAGFTGSEVKEKLKTLSRRGQGKPKDVDAGSEIFNLRGRFLLQDGILHLSDLHFRVAGAVVHLNGQYALRKEELDFRGTLRLQAKLSQTTTGVKSFLLKAVDPFFAKEGAGAVIPIKVTGTRSKPEFGLAMGGNSQKK
ncbi:MAG: AsmA-like C-terminal region-containing protein [Terriglobales bacterium]